MPGVFLQSATLPPPHIFCLSFFSISSQTSYTDYKLTPREYTLAGISIEGVSFLDHEVIIQKSGLQRGEKIAIPSDKISKAISKLWDQGLFSEVVIFKDIRFKDIPNIVINCSTLVGGVLIILGFAMGFTGYLVDAQIPLKILNFVQSTITSKIIFLLALNILLLIVGCLMDVFSAIIVVVPLIAPLAIYFGIDPFHLAIIFIANLELGYITPPVGMNLYLSSYRFEKDMPTIYSATLPFFFIRLIGVLFITYIPLFFY